MNQTSLLYLRNFIKKKKVKYLLVQLKINITIKLTKNVVTTYKECSDSASRVSRNKFDLHLNLCK